MCSCGCALKRIGEDVSEKLDYTPGVFHVERHIRGKWACAKCQTLIQAPVPAQVIDKGVPTAGLLAQVLVAKYADHQPLYRQEGIFERAGVAHTALDAGAVGRCLRRAPAAAGRCAEGDAARASSAARRRDTGGDAQAGQGEHAPGVYLELQLDAIRCACTRSFTTSPTAAPRRTRRHFSTAGRASSSATTTRGTRGLFADGVTEVGCLAHARRKFNDLWVNHQSPLAEEALQLFGKLYDVEREARELSAGERQRIRQLQSQPIADKLREWLLLQRQKATDGTAIAKAIDYSLGRWQALTRFLDDGALPIDNNWVENRIRPIALGRSNWLFAGSLRAGKRAAAVMSLIQSARLNGHDPYRYLKDVLERLPTQPASRIGELLPHSWTPATTPS